MQLPTAPFGYANSSWLVYLQWLAANRPQFLAANARYAPMMSMAEVGGLQALSIGGAPAADNGEPLPEIAWDPACLPAPPALDELAAQWTAPPPEYRGDEDTLGLHWRNYQANLPQIEPFHWLPPRAELAIVVGSGPSLAGQAELVAKAKHDRGAYVIAVNQVPRYIDPHLIDRYVLISPRADPAWWAGADLRHAVVSAFVGVPAAASRIQCRGIEWFLHLDGGPVVADAHYRMPMLPIVQAGQTVATAAFTFAARLGGIHRILMLGFDLSFPAGLERPGQAVGERELFRVRDVRGELVTTEVAMFQDAVRLSVMAAFLRARGVGVVNVGGQGLLGSIGITAADRRDLTIGNVPLADFLGGWRNR